MQLTWQWDGKSLDGERCRVSIWLWGMKTSWSSRRRSPQQFYFCSPRSWSLFQCRFWGTWRGSKFETRQCRLCPPKLILKGVAYPAGHTSLTEWCRAHCLLLPQRTKQFFRLLNILQFRTSLSGSSFSQNSNISVFQRLAFVSDTQWHPQPHLLSLLLWFRNRTEEWLVNKIIIIILYRL